MLLVRGSKGSGDVPQGAAGRLTRLLNGVLRGCNRSVNGSGHHQFVTNDRVTLNGFHYGAICLTILLNGARDVKVIVSATSELGSGLANDGQGGSKTTTSVRSVTREILANGLVWGSRAYLDHDVLANARTRAQIGSGSTLALHELMFLP